MKKQFFIFVVCTVFVSPVFGDCSYDALKNWKPSDGGIDNFLKCESITHRNDHLKPIHVALATFDNTNYSGNYEAVEAMLNINPDIAKGLEKEYPSQSSIQIVIDNCCKKGNNKTSDIVGVLIEKDPDAKNWVTRASMGDMETYNHISDKKSTMLDYVRYKMQYVDSCKNAEQCKKIEKLLVDAGAKTYAELQNEPSSNTVTTVAVPTPETPVVTEPLTTDEAQVKNEEPKEEVAPVPEILKTDDVVEEPASVPNNEGTEIPSMNTNDEKQQSQTQNLNQNDTDEEKQKAYNDAHETEQSIANKLLGGVSTAATGIGGMQLMQGLAEQSSDKDAMADMAAYIETMRCTYGDGQQVKAGFDEIELPGANDQELMNLRGEYLALAADLKERKTALGMKPGIESETIMDRASTGLYDDENVGITSGNYASLYRAQALKSEATQQKIDDAKNTSGNRVKYGATAAGAGAAVGITGDSLINGKLGDLLKSKDSEEK